MKIRLAALALILLLWVAPALGQGCAMCYMTAKALSADGQRAVNHGVLILLVPPFGFMTVGVGAALRYSKKRDEEDKE